MEDHVRGDRTAAGGVATGGDDRLPEHLAALHDRADMAGSSNAAEPVLAVGPEIEDIHELRGIPPGREALGGHTAWIVQPHRVHELEADPAMIEDGETGQPLRRRRVGKGAQDVPTVRIGVIPALPVGIGGGAVVAARLDAPGLSSLDREGAGAAGRTLEMECLQAHVLDGKEDPWGQTRLLDADGGRGLGHQLVAPPAPAP